MQSFRPDGHGTRYTVRALFLFHRCSKRGNKCFMTMAWLLLVAAGVLEVVWAYSMKLSEGFTRPLYMTVTVAGMIASFVLLATAMRSLPLGTTYTIWIGIGAVGSFIAGLYFLGEAASLMRILAAAVIVAASFTAYLERAGFILKSEFFERTRFA